MYKIKCECGGRYVGETERTLEIKEHMRTVQRMDTNCISAHFHQTNYRHWNSAGVIDREDHWHRRKVKEAIEISK